MILDIYQDDVHKYHITNCETHMQKTLHDPRFIKAMKVFLEFCMGELDLDRLPRIVWEDKGNLTHGKPTFGMFENETQTIYLRIKDRHPLDIMRTLAHELVHYKQFLDGEIHDGSGHTGSEQENQAHARAGIMMRHFDRAYPQLFKSKPIK
jgi:hypothetical protein